MAYGFVYVLSNDSMPGIYKIGMTEGTPRKRCDELSAATASACPFEVMMYLETKQPRTLEKRMHLFFDEHRVSQNREFFKVDLRKIFVEFSSWETEDCILAVSYEAQGVIACADYEDQKAAASNLLEVS